jgi:hypothetical protein
MRVYAYTTQGVETYMAIEAGIEAFMHGTMDTLLEAKHWRQMSAANTAWTSAYHALYWFGDRRSYAQRVLGDARLTALLRENEHNLLKAQAKADATIVADTMRTLVSHTRTYVEAVAKNTEAAQAGGDALPLPSVGTPAYHHRVHHGGMMPNRSRTRRLSVSWNRPGAPSTTSRSSTLWRSRSRSHRMIPLHRARASSRLLLAHRRSDG